MLSVTSATRSTCGPDASCSVQADAPVNPNISLPAGTSRCGDDSGPAAACTTDAPASAAGTSSTPAGQTACPAVAGKAMPATMAACSEVALTPDSPAGSSGLGDRPVVAPSVPIDSLGARLPDALKLTADQESVRSGKTALLTATANATITGSDRAIEIFDLTTGTVAGSCAQGSRCSTAYAAPSGVHEFGAFVVTSPTTSVPNPSTALPSNHVRVGWLDSTVSADTTVVAPGQPVTVTATSTFDVRGTGRWLEIYDLTAGGRLTYCTRGTSCSTTMKEPAGGMHEIVGYITGKPEAVSMPVYVTWLKVSLAATSIGPKTGGAVHLKATANADLANTRWVLGIYDNRGHLVDHVCKTGTTCSVDAWMDGKTTPKYTAFIGQLPEVRPSLIDRVTTAAGVATGQPLVDVQAKSATIEPTHLLWGVDSCKAMTGDPSGELFASVVDHLGTPQFWGRYLTDTVCPGFSSAEAALAARFHIGIMPIYNDYDCSAVSSYATGHAYSVAAVAAAHKLGIPSGRTLAIDIEPSGAACPGAAYVDSGFIDGWYEGVYDAGYVPVFYGNGNIGTEFATAWCAAVQAVPSIATESYLWSFEPSLLGQFNNVSNPNFAPSDTGCAGNAQVWQYVLSAGGNPDVDQDEVLSSVPLWYPS